MVDQVFESPHHWNFYSSSGRTSLGGSVRRLLRPPSNDIVLVSEITITSLWADRTLSDISFDRMHSDFTVTLHQVALSKRRIEKFLEDVEDWINAPTTKVSKELSSELHLDQRFELYLGPSRFSDRLEKAICNIHYSGIGFDTGSWSYEIDQSCARIFVDEWRRIFKNIKAGNTQY